jgi:hypothetical protein
MATAPKASLISLSSTTYPTPNTPKTPADEGVEFFQAEVHPGESPIRVYELRLDPDGGPSKDLSVRSYPYPNPISISDRAFSISGFLQHMYHTSCAFHSRQGLLLQRMAFSKQIFPSMVDLLDEKNTRRESACLESISLVCLDTCLL